MAGCKEMSLRLVKSDKKVKESDQQCGIEGLIYFYLALEEIETGISSFIEARKIMTLRKEPLRKELTQSLEKNAAKKGKGKTPNSKQPPILCHMN